MAKKPNRGRPPEARQGSEAQRWLQRAREIGEVAARAEYHHEERLKPRQDRGGYDWWRTHVHKPIHHPKKAARTP